MALSPMKVRVRHYLSHAEQEKLKAFIRQTNLEMPVCMDSWSAFTTRPPHCHWCPARNGSKNEAGEKNECVRPCQKACTTCRNISHLPPTSTTHPAAFQSAAHHLRGTLHVDEISIWPYGTRDIQDAVVAKQILACGRVAIDSRQVPHEEGFLRDMHCQSYQKVVRQVLSSDLGKERFGKRRQRPAREKKPTTSSCERSGT